MTVKEPNRSDDMSCTPWVESIDDVVSRVVPGDRISVGGVHFTRAPTALLLALARQRTSELTFVAWGGGLPLELLLAEGLVDEAEICFSNADVFGLAPRFRSASEDGSLRLQERTALQLMTGLRAAAEKVPWSTMQAPQGSSFNDEALLIPGAPPMQRVDAVEIDAVLLHAQRADDHGNVEIIGARATDVATVFAAKRVLVTVEERVRPGKLGARSSFVIPRDRVTAVAVAAGGAFPTSCLPFYPADIDLIGRVIAADRAEDMTSLLDAAPQATPLDPRVHDFAGISAGLRSIAPDAEADAWTIDELMAVWLAKTVDNNSICTCGSSAPLPVAAYMLAKRTHAPLATLISMNGCYVDIAERPLSLGLAEYQDFLSAALHCGGEDTYRWHYQAGRISHEVVGAAQIDAYGATNNLWVSRSDGRKIRLPGQGGMADVANLHRDFMIYLPRHSRLGTTERVEIVSSSRAWASDEVRAKYGYPAGKTVVLTDLCVMEPRGPELRLHVTSLHPGVSLEEVRAATGFAIDPAADCATTAAPTREELRILREIVDPLGVRKLDFVPARERSDMISQILRREASVLSNLTRDRMQTPRSINQE